MRGEEADRSVVTAWREILARHAAVWSALEHALSEHGLGVSEFEVLERLVENDERGKRWRAQDVAGSVYLSQSALSRVLGRLERDGLVLRSMCAEDRRGIYVELTDAGRERYTAARPTHRAVLEAELAHT